MPRTKSSTGAKPSPANKQKGKKICTRCHKEKNVVEFYWSASPLFIADNRVPLCKKCIQELCTNPETGEIDEIELNKTLRTIDKPYYKDSLASSYQQFQKEHSYIDEKDVKKYGDKVLGLYFKNIMLRQDRNKCYEDSEKDGFIHSNSNTSLSEKEKIIRRYSDIKLRNEEPQIKAPIEVKWSKEDKQNMKYVISKLGYDPFESVGLDDYDKKYCYNLLSGYFDTPGILEDGHKKQCVIEITMSYCQCRKITEELNLELSKDTPNEKKISALTQSKSSLLSSISTIAKDNNISSNYNKNSNQGQDSISSMMKEMERNGFEEIKVNFFDIKTSEAFKQIDAISNENIANQLTLDSNEYTDIVKEQREMIKNFECELDQLKEENRTLKNKIIDYETSKR